MKDNRKLIEELEKINFLAGTKKPILLEKEISYTDIETNPEEVGQITPEEEIESQLEKRKISDYLNTKESDFLSFPVKYAMVSTSVDNYIKDLEYLFMSLKNKNSSIEQIVEIIAPNKTYSSVPESYKLLQKTTQDFLKSLNEQKSSEIIPSDTLNSVERGVKSSFNSISLGGKNPIHYDFNRSENDLKLTPLGFWQIQFLSRIFKKKPRSQDDLEAVLFHSKSFGAYYNKAEIILSDFYKNAIYPMAAILTGRSLQVNPNDHEFQIMLQSSWDKIKDNIDNYDSSRENFGAWAFSVARNALIDQIKKFTDYNFQDTEDALNAIEGQGLIYLHFSKNMDNVISEEFLQPLNPSDKRDASEINRQSSNSTFLYKFKSPQELFDFLEMSKNNQSILKSLSKISRNILNSLKVFHSVKKFADVWPHEAGDETYDMYQKKAAGDEKDRSLKKLYELYKSNTDMSLNKKSFLETKDYELMLDRDGNKLYSDEELEDSFKRDVGMALFYYQTEFIKNFPHIETKIPGDVINIIIEKYVKRLPEITDIEKTFKSDSFKYIDKTLREKSRGDVIANPILFKNRNINNSIIEELAPYVRYDYKVARNMKKEDIIPTLRREFVKKQENRKAKEINKAKSENAKPIPVYTFADRVDEMFIQIGKGVSGIMNIKREREDASIVKKIELLDKFSRVLSNLTGFNIQLEESNKSKLIEINNYLFENHLKFIKKTLI